MDARIRSGMRRLEIPEEDVLKGVKSIADWGTEYLLPQNTVQVLREHRDRVKFVQFSNNGMFLASASSDDSVIIWKVPKVGHLSRLHTLSGHRSSVLYVSWSSNDKKLLSVGSKDAVKMWDVETGECLHSIEGYSPHFRPCAWLPDSENFVFASARENCVYKFLCRGDSVLLPFPLTTAIQGLTDLAILPNGEAIVYSSPRGICVQKFIDNNIRGYGEVASVSSVAVSRDSKRILLNLTNNEIHGWHMDNLHAGPVRFKDHMQAQCDIKSCFGGFNDNYVASGSEDSEVYIWKWGISKPENVLVGHDEIVNCVSWNPAIPQMLASASNDNSIRIWDNPSRSNYDA